MVFLNKWVLVLNKKEYHLKEGDFIAVDGNDIHNDHKIVNHCSLVASRPINNMHLVNILEYETLSEAELKDLLKGIQPNRDDFNDDKPSGNPVTKPSVPKTGGSATAPAN